MRIREIPVDNDTLAQIENIIKVNVGEDIRVEVKCYLGVDLKKLLEIISRVVNVPADVIKTGGRDSIKRMMARQILAYIASEYGGHKHEYIAAFLGRERSAVSQSIKKTIALVEVNDILICPALTLVLNQVFDEA